MTSGYKLEQAMSAAMQIREMLGDTEDEKLLADTIGGETDALEILDRLVEQTLADEALVDSARARIKRLEARADRRRNIVLQMMEAMGLKKLERALATLSVSYRTKPIITDASLLPVELLRTAPDMHAVANALKDGPVAGAETSNATAVLTLRTA